MQGYINIIIFCASAIAILLVVIKSHGRKSDQNAINRRFIEEEDAANAVRKKDLPPDIFYEADMDALPPVPEGDPHKVLRCARRKMIRFDVPMTNLDLKKQYGPAQMDIIAQYEENFNEYLRALSNWAQWLHDDGSTSDACVVLQAAISLGTQFRSTYKLTADIFAQTGQADALRRLHEQATNTYFADSAMHNSVISYIEQKQQGRQK